MAFEKPSPRSSPFFSRGCWWHPPPPHFDRHYNEAVPGPYGIAEPHYLVLDSLKVSRELEPGLDNYQLNTVSDLLGVELWHHHNALSDSEACAGILLKEEEKGQRALKSLSTV